ncbi:hypothetical protein SAMN05216282_10626 [Cryobacterium psychrotolerans]|uniref:Exo-alpha-sialidase n=1 Tax=Cryobacterium psychrotolerans TaxID=386301 RepID=A0A1G9BU04_9MICO|nr:hypothetical protein [Cryobacterium psychrotolerans]TFD84086.1 hypothetical protein E3T56_10245 [Cryobacterium psychrotolerans]SDK42873.1 hypothetical protein SAMN05216282_10626 [Cryobacterium psychrotolerans]
MAPFRKRGRNSRARRAWIVVGLVAFVLFDIALVYFALAGPAPTESAAKSHPLVEPLETQPPAVEPVETQPPVVEPVETVPPTRMLAALDGSTAWRAGTGPCPAAQASPELTTDSGATWSGSNASINTGASSILSINAINAKQASMVTLAAEGCAPQLVGTFVAGAEWADFPDRLSGNWYVDPADRATVHSPVGTFAAPCSLVIALAPRGDADGGVLCADGAFARTSNGGEAWGKVASLPGAVNLSATSDGYILAAADQKDCAGVQVLSTPEALDGAITPTGCRDAAFKPGEVALSSADGVVWLWAGNALSKSNDGGASWQ